MKITYRYTVQEVFEHNQTTRLFSIIETSRYSDGQLIDREQIGDCYTDREEAQGVCKVLNRDTIQQENFDEFYH